MTRHVRGSVALLALLLPLWFLATSQRAAAQPPRPAAATLNSQFQPIQSLPTGSIEVVAIGDFNLDNRRDVAVAGQDSLIVYLQAANGSLGTPVTYPVSELDAIDSIAVGDLNNDGRTDIVVASRLNNAFVLFRQQAGGTLTKFASYDTADLPDSIAIGDVSGDGRNDVVLSHAGAALIGVFVQQADGTLAPLVAYAAPGAAANEVAIGDVSGDGRRDVVRLTPRGVYVHRQNGSGTLDAPFSYPLAQAHAFGAVGDVTDEGREDVVTSYGGAGSTKLALYAQTVNGGLALSTTPDIADASQATEIADVDRDGDNDLLVRHASLGFVLYLLGPDGLIEAGETYAFGAESLNPHSLAVGDINGDSWPDAVVALPGSLGLFYHSTPGFALSVAPGGGLTAPGKAAGWQVTVESVLGFTDPTNLTLTGLPAGASHAFQPSTVVPTGQSQLIVQTSPTTPIGDYALTLTGTSGAVVRSLGLTLRVRTLLHLPLLRK